MKRAEFSPNNCPVQERTGDGVRAGRCWYYLRDGKCPRHGVIADLPEGHERHPQPKEPPR